MYSVDITIIGAGVIGLCVAHALSSSGKTIVVLEKEPGPGRGISSRNSEVIHAGIYYPAGSLKAKLCVRGARLLYDFCRKHHVAFNRTGKVVVAASPGEERSLEDLFRTGTNNGAEGLCLLTREELASIEPNITGLCALYSPNTGIIDSHHLIKRIEALCLNSG
ncbi:MAG: FAD-dependent oxidoreductase, partial [Deltaproteobacteria bacterium]|nr:FAD-dependent oxidoreductase [Deltaproteobacteria bacterium]